MRKKEARTILVMDFDGVIVDSTDEGLLTSFCVYKKINPKTKIFNGNLNLANFKKIIKKFTSQYTKFIVYRPYLRTVIDYYYMLYFIDNKINPKNSLEFKKESKKVLVDKKKFVYEFYKIRNKFIRENFLEWVILEPIYPHMKKFFSKRQVQYYVSTANRKSTILKTFRYFGIRINPMHILDNRVSTDKKVHIEIIKNIEKIDYSDMIFVDDQLGHFLNVNNLGVNCILAGWGYVNAEQLRKTRRMGIRIANPTNLVEMLRIK